MNPITSRIRHAWETVTGKELEWARYPKTWGMMRLVWLDARAYHPRPEIEAICKAHIDAGRLTPEGIPLMVWVPGGLFVRGQWIPITCTD